MAEPAQPLAPDYELKTVKVGSYTVLQPSGVNTPDLLEEITDQFLEQAWLLAVDLRKLRKINLPLIRALWEYGQRTGGEGGRLIFIDPSDRIRAMLRLLAGDELVQLVRWQKQLEGTPEEVDTRVREYIRDLYEMALRLGSDPTFRYLDNERNWVCPYCATLRDTIRIVSFENPPAAVVEKVLRHLQEDCPNYMEQKAPWPHAVLERLVQHANEQKHASSPESKIRKLEQKARKADEMEKRLEVAVKLQRQLLPSAAPAIQDGEMGIIYRPVEELGGDFYDFVPMNMGQMAIIIGDVSGHGVEAGVLMGMAKKNIQLRLKETLDPLVALSKANSDLYEDIAPMSFVSAFVGIFDPREKTLLYARAGHTSPLLYNPMRSPKVRAMDAKGGVLGVSDDEKFEMDLQRELVQLEDGDIVLFLTDGVEDTKNAAGEEFGIERIIRVVEEGAHSEADAILANLSMAIDAFRGDQPQEDDFSAICVKLYRP